jgi:hypothetical protein
MHGPLCIAREAGHNWAKARYFEQASYLNTSCSEVQPMKERSLGLSIVSSVVRNEVAIYPYAEPHYS